MLLCSGSIHINVPLENAGEDAVLCLTDREDAILAAVFDGCGGSGGRQYPKAGGWTGAKLASRVGVESLSHWFALSGGKSRSLAASCAEIGEWTRKGLQRAYELVKDGSASRIVSSMSLSLPTTLAAVTARVPEDNCYCLRYYWAGDSRGYLFLPGGLVQITRDNSDAAYGDGESMEDFMDTNPNNVLSAARDYTVYGRELSVREPCMVLVASDGCTSCLRSPLELEQLLLETLAASASLQGWEEEMKAAFTPRSADDYSLVLCVLGFQSFEAVKTAYAPRLEEFRTRYAPGLSAAWQTGDTAPLYGLWEEYKPFYLGKNLTIREATS